MYYSMVMRIIYHFHLWNGYKSPDSHSSPFTFRKRRLRRFQGRIGHRFNLFSNGGHRFNMIRWPFLWEKQLWLSLTKINFGEPISFSTQGSNCCHNMASWDIPSEINQRSALLWFQGFITRFCDFHRKRSFFRSRVGNAPSWLPPLCLPSVG